MKSFITRFIATSVLAVSLFLGLGGGSADAAFYTYQYTDCYGNGWCKVTTVVCSDEATFYGNPCQYYNYWYQWTYK